MLRLTDITKVYPSGNVTALSGVSIAFRKNEFVSILGPSGCGKTTLLNIIGGLDRYTSGELCVRHVPTAKFSDRDWDSYRNHSIGFVFQSYNLIPHQSVLANVELALTLSGVSKAERRRRAEEALTAVGLADQMKKKPSQMSGGQMQRVAIARALVNDPDILLADEPTGALDSETSVQIMEILREVAKNKLIIMVTHNPDLAEQYSTRIIRVLDGRVTEDTNPYSPEEEEKESYTESEVSVSADEKVRGKKRTSMSFGTALGLSLNNLMTKKARTFLTAFAGSIGIIGIAAILALSHGISLYIDKVQEDTLSAYPIQIDAATVDMSSLMTTMMAAREENESDEETADDGAIHSNTMMYDLMDTMMSVEVQENNLTDFIAHIEDNGGDFEGHASAVAYGYHLPMNIYSVDRKSESGMPLAVNPSELFSGMMAGAQQQGGMASMMASGLTIWQEMIDNPGLMQQQYELVAGTWPENWNEVVLVADENYRINDVYLYALGFKDPDEFYELMRAAMKGEAFNAESESWTYDEIIGKEFALVLPSDTYEKEDGVYKSMKDNTSFMQLAVEGAEKIVITGILRPNPEAVATSITGAIGYLPALSEYILDRLDEADVIREQKEHPETDIFLDLPFATEENNPENLTDAEKAEAIRSAFDKMIPADRAAAYTKSLSTLSDEEAAKQAGEQLAVMPPEAVGQMLVTVMAQQAGESADEATVAAYLAKMSEEEKAGYAMQILTEQVKKTYADTMQAQMASMTTAQLSDALGTALDSMSDEQTAATFAEYMPAVVSDSTCEKNLRAMGWVDREKPSFMRIYAETFEAKDEIARIIADYNAACTDDGREEDVINYTDYVALMMSSISTIIDVISYVLIAFVSISLVVSSIMIGIITYISVLERTKEIGILRAVGASKKDISRVFNAETLILGFTSGAIGIGVTLLICIPANIIIKHLTDISNLAQLPVEGGVALVIISMVLTMIAGLIPSGLAAKKDPVEALRNE